MGSQIDRLNAFKAAMFLHAYGDEIMCRAFPTTLKDANQAWYSQLLAHSIYSFKQMNKLFAKHFINNRRCPETLTSLMLIKQKVGETLKQYAVRFNEVPPSDELGSGSGTSGPIKWCQGSRTSAINHKEPAHRFYRGKGKSAKIHPL